MKVRFVGLALLALLPAVTVNAEDRLSRAGNGGSFGIDVNWEGGLPGAEDTAVFDIAATYAVIFLGDEATAAARVAQGTVEFDLRGFTYTLVDPSASTPGLRIAPDAGNLATLEVRGGALQAAFGGLGLAPGALGTLDLEGDGSTAEFSEVLQIGTAGVGFFDLRDGATFSADRCTVGQLAGAYGELALDLGASAAVTGAMTLGQIGTGVMRLESGATLTAGSALVGQELNSSGEALLTGAGTRWKIDGTLDVGFRGTGAITVEDGAALRSMGPSVLGTLPGDQFSGGDGAVTVRGAGARWSVAQERFAGDLIVGLLGRGHLTVANGGRITVDGDLVISADGGGLDLVIGAADVHAAPIVCVEGETMAPRVNVLLSTEWMPAAGDRVTLMSSAHGGLDTVEVELPAPPDGLAWTLERTATTLVLAVAPDFCLTADEKSDCDADGIEDGCAIFFGLVVDCNGNGVPDPCDIAAGAAADCDGNGVLDVCDLASGAAEDCDGNGVPDACDRESGAILMPPSSTPGFGSGVDTDGEHLIVAAPFDRANQGAAFIFEREGAGWAATAELRAVEGASGDVFGVSVGLDGDIAAAGARSFDGEEGSGAVWIYHRDGAAWRLETRLDAPDGTTTFGRALSVDGERVAVGASISGGGFGAAPVFIYIRDGGAWTLEAALPVPAPADLLQPFIDLADDVLVMNPTPLSGARIYVYRRTGSAWAFEEELRPPFGVDYGAVATDGATIVISSTGSSVFVYRFDGEAWRTEAELEPVGASCSRPPPAIDGDRIVLGGCGDAAILFERQAEADGPRWRETSRLRALDGGAGSFASAVALASPRVIATRAGLQQAHTFNLDTDDCDDNGVDDYCDVANGGAADGNGNGIPDACENLCREDLDGDGDVGFSDLLRVISTWGPCPGCAEDLDIDAEVGFGDLLQLLSRFGACGA